MSEMSTEARVREYITANFLLPPGASPSRDLSLLNEGIIDSTGYLEVFRWLKDEFGITVAADEMGTENFETIGNITAYIDRKLAEAAR
jgi:acyl carrier protein